MAPGRDLVIVYYVDATGGGSVVVRPGAITTLDVRVRRGDVAGET